jgi:hypothetical protein
MTRLTRPLLAYQDGSCGALSGGTSEFSLFSSPPPPTSKNCELWVDSKSGQNWPRRSCHTLARLSRPSWATGVTQRAPQDRWRNTPISLFSPQVRTCRKLSIFPKKKSLRYGSAGLAMTPRGGHCHFLRPPLTLGHFENSPFSDIFSAFDVFFQPKFSDLVPTQKSENLWPWTSRRTVASLG